MTKKRGRTRICKECGNSYDTYGTKCMNCFIRKSRSSENRRKKNPNWKEEPKHFIKSKVSSSVNEDRNHDRYYNINAKYIRNLYSNSSNCHITNMKLPCKLRSLYAMSIDRINNNLGHTKDNVQLISSGLNLLKNKFSNDQLILFLDVLCGFKKYSKARYKVKNRVFSLDIINSNLRNYESKSDITDRFVMELYNKQNGLCALSGVPMEGWKRSIFTISVDRIDNSKGHMIDNCRLLCLGINLSKGNFSDEYYKKWLDDIKDAYRSKNGH